MNDERPRLIQERVYDKELPESDLPSFSLPQFGTSVTYHFPHCDSLILHVPEECEYCAACTDLQEERERLDVSNTGRMNRRWMCPADVRRSPEQYDKWHGNRRAK